MNGISRSENQSALVIDWRHQPEIYLRNMTEFIREGLNCKKVLSGIAVENTILESKTHLYMQNFESNETATRFKNLLTFMYKYAGILQWRGSFFWQCFYYRSAGAVKEQMHWHSHDFSHPLTTNTVSQKRNHYSGTGFPRKIGWEEISHILQFTLCFLHHVGSLNIWRIQGHEYFNKMCDIWAKSRMAIFFSRC